MGRPGPVHRLGGDRVRFRAAIQARRTGDAGFRGIRGRPGSASWWAGILFVLALLGGAAVPIAAICGMPVLPGAGTPWRWAGLVITTAGIAATLAGQSAMGTSWRVGVDSRERTALVMTGMFASVRNPVFTAMTVTAIGLALMVPSAVAVLALAALVTAVQMQVRIVEKPHLRSVHGAAYDAYAARAGRFLPGIGRRTA
ncbi:methyltransferase [Streptomyces sp. NPDC048659]|uniref:methyltransferase family protein n=1 Tax=Streptomyces sp. NPDC048659 TaxID=3155489 RepID=UPI00341D4F58